MLTTAFVLLTCLPLFLDLRRQPGALRLLERQLGQRRYTIATMGCVLDAALLVMLSCFCPFHMRMVCRACACACAAAACAPPPCACSPLSATTS